MTLAYTQFLNFEIGTECNLGEEHTKCPNRHPDRYANSDTRQKMSDDTIVACVMSAYGEHGFTGLVGWHYYNEPMLHAERILRLMTVIRTYVPESRFVMWTNGAGKGVFYQSVRDMCEQWHVTPYETGVRLDDRLDRKPSQGDKPCMRIFTEFVLDVFGQHHPCCFDWRGEASLGNVHDVGFTHLVCDWWNEQQRAGNKSMMATVNPGCWKCGWRTSAMTQFDPESAARAEAWRASCGL